MAAIKHPGGTAADTSWVDAANRAARRVDLANMVKNARRVIGFGAYLLDEGKMSVDG